ncbi:hypothetical protein [Histidinibacterium lentulum]|uniref:Alpha/beta hydrolase n=1 Tax=Histidinibacterium lentulum TaxID=2480588 RepID=A0A3N2QW74_9RHOB|nr:hypothetical protein [Histidinibacterium lentulum]ROT99491.1 hypothetical protein EAT49_14880 [Histidinibacterium lentulum]
MDQSILFRAQGARIALLRGNRSGRVTVFFAGRSAAGTDVADTYGGAFAREHGLNAILVQPAKARWYQPPLAGPLTAALRRALRGFDHLTFAGSGMGAYGALSMAERIEADHVLAVRPVATLDAARAPVTRAHARDLERLGADLEPVLTHRAGRYTVVPDGSRLGAAHVARFYLPGDRTVHEGPRALQQDGPLGLDPGRLLSLLGETRDTALSA